MTTKDFVVFVLMLVGAIMLFLTGMGIADNYKDAQFLPIGLFFWLVGVMTDRFWRPA